MYHYGWGAGGSWLMLLWMLIFWGGLLTVGIFMVRALFGVTSSPSHQPPQVTSSSQTALSIAQERYARGEITREQYLQIIQDMKKDV